MAADDDKKLILARRARFVAAALAGVSVACGKEPTPPPEPCLSVPISPRDADTTEPPPQPCLSPVPRDPDAEAPPASDAGPDAATTTTREQQTDAGVPPPKPRPCLSPPAPTTSNKPPIPMPCLSVVKPPDKKQ